MDRFLKGNARRFFRYDRELRLFIKPKQKSDKENDLVINGIDYFNKATEDKILGLKIKVVDDLKGISTHQDILKQIVKEFFRRFDIVTEYLRQINKGFDPKKRAKYWKERETILTKFSVIEQLKSPAPRTYELLKKIESKFLVYAELIQKTSEKSNEENLYFKDCTDAFIFKPVVRKILNKKNITYKDNRLLSLMVELERLFEVGFEPLNNLSNDYLLYDKHKFWPNKAVNISACGVSVSDNRKYSILGSMDIRLVIDDNVVIDFEGRVVRHKYCSSTKRNITGIDFYFPNPVYQKDLLAFLHRLETQEAMRL